MEVSFIVEENGKVYHFIMMDKHTPFRLSTILLLKKCNPSPRGEPTTFIEPNIIRHQCQVPKNTSFFRISFLLLEKVVVL